MERKRKYRKRKSSLDNNINENQSYTDFLCPICLQILIEPVQMPCKHELCMQCFKLHVETTSLQCPMCRLRISVWIRRNNQNLINTQRWKLIKSLFPDRVQRRMDGKDDLDSCYSEYNAPKHVIATDGEVRKEYEEELKKIQQEEEAMTQADLEYIHKLQLEEKEAQRKQEELDKAAAKALQEEEMKNLGVTLKSPSTHQRELLALLRPKSPMKLRDRKEVNMSNQKKTKAQITSPSHTITSFFQKKDDTKSDSLPDSEPSTPNLKIQLENHKNKILSSKTTNCKPCCSKTTEEKDFEFARKLQQHFDEEAESDKVKPSKKPLRMKNSISPLLGQSMKLRRSNAKFAAITMQENR